MNIRRKSVWISGYIKVETYGNVNSAVATSASWYLSLKWRHNGI